MINPVIGFGMAKERYPLTVMLLWPKGAYFSTFWFNCIVLGSCSLLGLVLHVTPLALKSIVTVSLPIVR